jgi:hypothetical protein
MGRVHAAARLHGSAHAVLGSGAGGHVDLGEEVADAAFDVVADGADVGEVETGGVVEVPVLVAAAGGTRGRCRRSLW